MRTLTSNPSARWKAHVSRRRTVIYGLPVWLACLALAACASLATKAEGRGGDTVTR